MIVYSEKLIDTLRVGQLLSYLKSNTVQPYRPFSCGYTHSYELKSLPDFRLIEGVIVPPHGKELVAYRPILMLHNPSNKYVLRGMGQREARSFRPGQLVVLDIDAEHEVRSLDPIGDYGPWAGLIWGIGGQPLMKEEWSVEHAAEIAKQEFLKLSYEISNL